MKETQTPETIFTITYDPDLVDVSAYEAELAARQKHTEALQWTERAETVKHTLGRVGTFLGTRMEATVLNSERAVRWLGREMLADALCEPHDGGYDQ